MTTAAPRDDEEGAVLAEQLAYYRARAPEYDKWWYKTDQYSVDDDRLAEWWEEVAWLEAAVGRLAPLGSVLELACGTGLWTVQLARWADGVTAVDAAPETLALNRERMADSPIAIEYVEHDLFTWQPAEHYDTVFFSFWLSHVPPGRWQAFWDLVAGALAPGGRAIFIDNCWREGKWPATETRPTGWRERRTDIGGEYQIVKRYWDAPGLEAELAATGWQAEVQETVRSFLFGVAVPA